MSYKIYKLVKPEHLQKMEPDGYHMKTIDRLVLEVPNYSSGLTDDYPDKKSAKKAILENPEYAKYKDFCILQVVSLGWNGEIK